MGGNPWMGLLERHCWRDKCANLHGICHFYTAISSNTIGKRTDTAQSHSGKSRYWPLFSAKRPTPNCYCKLTGVVAFSCESRFFSSNIIGSVHVYRHDCCIVVTYGQTISDVSRFYSTDVYTSLAERENAKIADWKYLSFKRSLYSEDFYHLLPSSTIAFDRGQGCIVDKRRGQLVPNQQYTNNTKCKGEDINNLEYKRWEFRYSSTTLSSLPSPTLYYDARSR